MTMMCRGCLTTEMDLVPMDDTFINKFNLITGLNLNNFDSCLYSCQKCCNAVKFCMEFRGQCIESDWSLQEMAAQTGSVDVRIADSRPVSPPTRRTKNQRKKYAVKRRRAAMREALAKGDIRCKDTLVCSNAIAEVSDGDGMTKMKSDRVTGTVVTTSMVTPSSNSNETISCSPILHLDQGQTTKRKNTEIPIQDCQATKKLKINECVKMGFSADRQIIHKNSQQDKKIEKAVNKVNTASLVIENASSKGTSFHAQGMVTSVSTSSPITPATTTIDTTKSAEYNTALICQKQTTKHSIFSSISLLHQAMRSKIEDSPFMSPENVDTSGDKPKKKKRNKSKKQRMKMAELKEENVNNIGAVVIVDNNKTGATSDSTVVATNCNSMLNVNQRQTTKCFRNPDTHIQNQYANINNDDNVASNKGVSDVKLKFETKKKGANDNNITAVVIATSVEPPSYGKSATISGNATTAVIGAKTVRVAPAVTVANSSAALKCSSGQNTKPKNAKSTPVTSCSPLTLFTNSGVTPVVTSVAAKCCSVVSDASLGKESITPEVQLNKERPPLSLNALYQVASSVLKKKLVQKKKHKQSLKQLSVVKSDGAGSLIKPVDAVSLINPGDDASVVIPDRAAPVTRSVDTVSLIKPVDAASLINPGDDASVVIPDRAAPVTRSVDTVSLIKPVDAASLINPGDDASVVIPDRAAPVTRSVDTVSLIKPGDDASAVIPDGAAPVANSDGATPMLV